MQALHLSVDVNASVDDVWKLLSDVDGFGRFMVGITKWEAVEGREGHYWILMQVGSIATGGEVIVDVDESSRTVEWASIRGTRHEARLVVEPTGPRTSRIDLDFTFRLTGPVARLVELTARSIVQRNFVATLETARHVVEHDDLLL